MIWVWPLVALFFGFVLFGLGATAPHWWLSVIAYAGGAGAVIGFVAMYAINFRDR